MRGIENAYSKLSENAKERCVRIARSTIDDSTSDESHVSLLMACELISMTEGSFEAEHKFVRKFLNTREGCQWTSEQG